MYKIFLTIILGSIGYLCFAQQSLSTNYRLATEGGGRNIIVDTVTPTLDLIKMLEQPWSFKTTGKAYYIGFTELMFSIAHKGEGVIDTLIDYYKTTSSYRAKQGIIYTLYLIGIERKTGSRLNESFKNKKARKALISLLPYGINNETIAKLLMRDPWLSDIPELIDYLSVEKNTEYTWPVVKSLMRYNVPDFCIGQAINEPAQSYTITNPDNAPYLLRDSIVNDATKNSLQLFEKAYPHFINVEQSLFEQDLNGDSRVASEATIRLIGFIEQHNTGSFYPFSAVLSFSNLGSRFVHYVEGGMIHFCSIETAQERIVNWWSGLAPKKKTFFENKNFYNRP